MTGGSLAGLGTSETYFSVSMVVGTTVTRGLAARA
jgi:hypothetical protein